MGFTWMTWVGHTKSQASNYHFEHMIAPLKYAASVNEIIDYPLPDFNADYRHRDFEDRVKKLTPTRIGSHRTSRPDVV